jgi:hypothetical protein
MMAAFYQDLASSPDLALPIAQARQRWSAALDLATDAGIVQIVAARVDDGWPYRCPGCPCELILEAGTMLAVCGEEFCEPAEVDARLVRVVPDLLQQFVAAACGVGPVDRGRPLTRLGARRVGNHEVAFVWAGRPHAVDEAHVAFLVDEEGPDVLVVLIAHRQRLPVGRTRRRGRTRVFWLGLDDVLSQPSVGLDLSELWLRFRVGAVELLWPRFDLVLETTRALWAGKWIELARHPLHHVLLGALLDAGDAYIARGDLLPVLFPDEFTNRGRVLTDPTKLDRRLRQLVSRVNAHFGVHPDGRLLIGNLRARSDIDGGYRIEVARDRIHVSKEFSHV